MGGCGLHDRIAGGISNKDFLSGNANAFSAMFGVDFRYVVLQPSAVAIKLFALLSRLRQFISVGYFLHLNDVSFVHSFVLDYSTLHSIARIHPHQSLVKQKDFDRLVTSVKQAGAIRRGKLKPSRVTEFRPEDVRTIRIQLEMSQEEFARMIGVSVATLQNWEQGRRRPEGPARALLRVAAKNPQAVAEALAS